MGKRRQKLLSKKVSKSNIACYTLTAFIPIVMVFFFCTCKFCYRLGLDYIDTYLIHSPLQGKIIETWDAMVELQQEKLVRSIGVSNFSVEHLKELKKARPNNIPAGVVCVWECVGGWAVKGVIKFAV